MLQRLGSFAVRRRRRVLVGGLLIFVLAGAIGGGVAEHLSQGGFEDPGAESIKEATLLQERFGQGDPELVLLVTARSGNVDDPEVVEAGNAITAELAAEDGVGDVVSYWGLGSPPPLRSRDGSQALVLARLPGSQDAVQDIAEHLGPKYQRDGSVVKVEVTGFAEVFRQVGSTIERDLARAEMIALPVTLLLLVLVFGSVVAASLPLAIGAVAVVGTFLVLRVLASVTEVSIFALNLTTAMGLGLAIDYSLFVVSRYREELANGHATGDAVVRTVRTAGRTVVFSAATVAASLAALLIFPLAFLRSFAYAGISVVAVAAVATVVLLPAMLAALGPRIDRLRIRRVDPRPSDHGFWHRLATTVMRRPIPVATVVVLFLLFLGSPFLRIQFGMPDDRVLPEGAPARVATDQIREGFGSVEAMPVEVLASGIGDPQARAADIAAVATELSQLEGVTRVDALTGIYIDGAAVPRPPADTRQFAAPDSTWFNVVADVEPLSPEGEALVERIRSLDTPFPSVLVGGVSAELVDSKDRLFALLPWAGLIIAIVTFVVLFLMFGSLLVPAKAVVLNLLSLTATFGAMVWIFQDGNLSGALDFTATGVIDTTTPILMFCVAFGLSMDYEVFLLSRIKEEHDAGRDTVGSVAMGLERTGRIVTAAAALIAVVFLAFSTSEVTFIKLFGLGLALAVILDATIVRGALVPAFMRLAGQANWWAPRPLARLYDRIGFSEAVDLDERAQGSDAGDPASSVPVEPVLTDAAGVEGNGGTSGGPGESSNGSNGSNGKGSHEGPPRRRRRPLVAGRDG